MNVSWYWLPISLLLLSCSAAAETTRMMVAKTDVDTIVLAIESYEAQTGHYPTTEQGLAALLDAIVPNIEKPQLKEPIIFRLPLDPWGNNYQYITPGKYNKHYDVWSFGADGKPGGEGINADCGNWRASLCYDLRPNQQHTYIEFATLALIGFLLGAPLYLYKSIANWRRRRIIRQSLIGFHLGVWLYLTLVPMLILLIMTLLLI